eukprot:CAMPEP_0178967086 /NCGR_PEP_ID=MMETSP0789-20121207/17347_1 /TAXON_ID=3005 /ORGANISM="Rhizosolenia setigera, Strain CCMP 1694" /LENGTH=398 /DNA_ID=CAMNT_0020652553 /DNA_START=288 /DNA_END=1484 /DNA_ORIENTATION=-
MHPNIPFGSVLMTILYSIDAILMIDAGDIAGPRNFVTARQEILGKNFAALGNVVVTDYSETAALIEAPQKRGNLVGGLRMNPNYILTNFVLVLSDEEAGGTELHSQMHEYAWNSLMPQALNRTVEDEGGVFASYLSEGKENMNAAGADKAIEIFRMTIRYSWHAFFGEAIDEDTVTMVFNRFKGDASTILSENRIIGAVMPFSPLMRPFQGPAEKAKEILVEKILNSPYMETYDPSENGNIDKNEWAEHMLYFIGINAVSGSARLNINIEKYASVVEGINTTSEEDLTLAVLETARLRPPAINMNLISQEEKTLVVNGDTVTIPADTIFSASVGGAGWDEDEFPDPHTFDHTRANLVNSSLNFNHVGWDPDTLGTRVCTGRKIAMKFGIDWLALLKEE